MAWRTRHGGAAVLAVLVALVLWTQPAHADTTLEATTPTGDYYQNAGGRVPLLVTITSDGATDGDVVVVFEERPIASTSIEIPGGSTKTVVLGVPVFPWGGSYSIRYTAADDADSATRLLNLRPAGGDELVGVLPGLAARGLPDSADLTVDVGDARLFALDPTLLDDGSRVLSGFSYVVGTADDIDDLAGSRRDAVLDWVRGRGGTLVVADNVGASALAVEPGLDFLESDPDMATFGVGQVQFVGAAFDGGFDGVLAPRSGSVFNEFFGFEGIPTTTQLAGDAGVRVPAIDALVIAILVYALVAGPLLWIVLRRRRREPLLWLAIPVLAALATGVVYVTGQAIRDSASTSHATVDVHTPGGRYTATHVLVTSRNGGSAGIRIDDGWQPLPANPFAGDFIDVGFRGGGPFGQPVPATGGGQLGGGRLTLDLDPGGFGVVRAESLKQEPGDGPFDVVARYTDDGISVEITNVTDQTLHDAMVASSSQVRTLGSLEPGETTEVAMGGGLAPMFEPDPVWNQLMRGDAAFRPNEGNTNPGILLDFLNANRHLRRDGLAMVVGWTRELDAPVRTTAGRRIESGRTALGTIVRIEGQRSGTDHVTVIRGLETGQRTVDRPRGDQCAEGALTVRVDTPADAWAEDAPVLDVKSRRISALDVWVGDAWTPAMMSEHPLDPVFALPPEAVTDGATFIRFAPSCEGFGRNDVIPTLRAEAPDDATVPLGGDPEEEEGSA